MQRPFVIDGLLDAAGARASPAIKRIAYSGQSLIPA